MMVVELGVTVGVGVGVGVAVGSDVGDIVGVAVAVGVGVGVGVAEVLTVIVWLVWVLPLPDTVIVWEPGDDRVTVPVQDPLVKFPDTDGLIDPPLTPIKTVPL